MADWVGRQLGNYRVVRLLGKGSFAEVYLGQHLYLNRQVAIKILHELTGQSLEQFRQEARRNAELEHPHILKILDFGVQQGTPFLVMQLAPNGTLRERHPFGKQLALETILPYINQVAAALDYAHEHKVIHQDIKQENLLLGQNHEVLVSDFGIAVVTQHTKSYVKTDGFAGSPAYAAPEQFQGRPAPGSDQYALGVVVYQWLTGVFPFEGAWYAIGTQKLHRPPPPLHLSRPDVAPAVEAVVLRALAIEPRERFESVQAFAQALEDAAGPRGTIYFAATEVKNPLSAATLPSANPPVHTQHEASPTGAEQPPRGSSSASLSRTGPTLPPANLTRRLSLLDRTQAPAERGNRWATRPLHERILMGLIAALLIAILGMAVNIAVHAVSGSPTEAIASTATVPGEVTATATNDASPTPTATPTGVPLAPQSALYAGIVDGSGGSGGLQALNSSDGSLLWSFTTNSGIYTTPTIVNGVVYLDTNSVMYALRASDGYLLWKFPTNGEVSSPMVANGVVYFGENQYMCALRASDGGLLWQTQISQQSGVLPSLPALDNGVLYSSANDASLYALRASDGALLWHSQQYELGQLSAPVLSDGTLYAGSNDHNVYALRPSDGAVLWHYQTGDYISSSPPTVVNGVVYAGSADQYVYALRASDGSLLWRSGPLSGAAGNPVVVNGAIYLNVGEQLYAFQASNGTPLWHAPKTLVVEGTPVVANGMLYISASDDRIYALRASDGASLWQSPKISGTPLTLSPTTGP